MGWTHSDLFVCHDNLACDYATILPAATALLRFRMQHAATNALSVYLMSREETAWDDISGISIAAQAARLQSIAGAATPRVRMPREMSFALDPLDEGLKENWFASSKSGGGVWNSTIVGPDDRGAVGWNASSAGLRYFAAHGKPYTGVAWYRDSFTVPASCGQVPLALASAGISSGGKAAAAVEGGVQVWINGQPVPLDAPLVASGSPFVTAILNSTTLKRPWNTSKWNSHCLTAAACRARWTPRDPFRIQTCNVTADCAVGTGVEPKRLTCERKLVTCRAGVCNSGAVNGTLCVEPAAEPENLLVVRIDGKKAGGVIGGVPLGLTNLLWLAERL